MYDLHKRNFSSALRTRVSKHDQFLTAATERARTEETETGRLAMLTRIFAAAVLLAVLTSTVPAHAAYVSAINADLDLHFANGDELTGNINLTHNDPYAAAHEGPSYGSADLSVNGIRGKVSG